jgi:hypothetical protein
MLKTYQTKEKFGHKSASKKMGPVNRTDPVLVLHLQYLPSSGKPARIIPRTKANNYSKLRFF